jgi:hypothetical protein
MMVLTRARRTTFRAAIALEPEERKAFLRQECGQDELRHTVEALLIQDANAGSILEHPPFDLLRHAVVVPARPVLCPDETLPLLPRAV